MTSTYHLTTPAEALRPSFIGRPGQWLEAEVTAAFGADLAKRVSA